MQKHVASLFEIPFFFAGPDFSELKIEIEFFSGFQ
jgi:hypothetical protein